NTVGNVITGNTAANILSGAEDNDTLIGGAGDDTLDGGIGADSMAGGTGNDQFVVEDSGDIVFESSNQGTDLVRSSVAYTLTSNVENLALTGSGAINGTGNGLANLIDGNDSDNVLTGGAGRDTLLGHGGDDSIVYDAADFLIDGGAGVDTLVLAGSGATLNLTAIANTVIVGTEQIDLTGTGDNTVVLLAQDVLDLSDTTDALLIKGNAGDTAISTGGWVIAGQDTIGGEVYTRFTEGSATVRIDTDINVASFNVRPFGADATVTTDEDIPYVFNPAS